MNEYMKFVSSNGLPLVGCAIVLHFLIRQIKSAYFRPKPYNKVLPNYSFVIYICAAITCVFIHFIYTDKKITRVNVEEYVKQFALMRGRNDIKRIQLTAFHQFPTLASIYIKRWQYDKSFILHLPTEFGSQDFDKIAKDFFRKDDASNVKLRISKHEYDIPLQIIRETKQRLEDEGKSERYVDSTTEWMMAAVFISAASVETDEKNQHNILVMAAELLIDALAVDNSFCPAAFDLWVMTNYSTNFNDYIIDKDLFLKDIDALNPSSFKGDGEACAYSLDLLLTLAVEGHDLRTIDAVVANVTARADWGDKEATRLYIYLHAEDFYLWEKNLIGHERVIEAIYAMYKRGIEPANIYRLFLLSLGMTVEDREIGGSSELSHQYEYILDFVKPITNYSGQKIYSYFDSMNVDTQKQYVSAAYWGRIERRRSGVP